MKTLKFNHEFAQMILAGQKTTTWRLFDDKELSINDEIKIIDKVSEADPASWKIIGTAVVTEITEKKLGNITQVDMEGHQVFESSEKMLAAYRGYYGARVNLDSIVKIVHFIFTEGNGDEAPTQSMLLEEAKLYTDGGSRGNPGMSAYAFVICNLEGNVVEKSGKYIGIATNNQAEYYGFIKGMERSRDLGINKLVLNSDSQLVVSQMNGNYRVKNQELLPLYEQAKELATSFESITFLHIPRELNKEADGEVNRILDERQKNEF